MTITLVSGCARRITSDIASGGLGDNPASKRIMSAGVLETALRVACNVSVWATTSRSFSTAKIFPIPTRKIASESATIIRTGEYFVSIGEEWIAEPVRRDVRSVSWRGTEAPSCSEPLEFVLVDDNRNAPAGRLF